MPQQEGSKTRELNTTVNFPPSWKKSGGNWVELTPAKELTWKGIQRTVSEGHKKTKGRYLEGGPFFTERISADIGVRHITLQHVSGWPKYSGAACVPLVPQTAYSGIKQGSLDSSYLDPIGATAVSLSEPTNPNAQLGVALGELTRDGLPIPGIQAWRRRTEVAKAAGSEYLNAVFGWLPLVSDIKDTAQSVLDKNTILKGYRENAGGRGVRREFEFPVEKTTSENFLGKTTALVCGGATTFNYPPAVPVPVTCTTTTEVRRWFSGAFTYASPDSNDAIGRMLGIGSEAEKLFGLSLTPDIVWELTPWSWAVDWFTNAGDVINNLSAFKLGGLIMRYGYIMEETTMTKVYSMPEPGISDGKYLLAGSMPSSTVTSVTKRRRPANPFGFGLSWDGLSPSQLLITAALGITRLR